MRYGIIVLGFVALLSAGVSAQVSIITGNASQDHVGSVKVGTPATHWSRIYVSVNRPTNWSKVTVIGAFSARILKNNVPTPFGPLRIDLTALFHYDPSMKVRPVVNSASAPREAIVWTKLPPLPTEAIGTLIWYQVLLYNNVGSPNYNLSQIAHTTIVPR